MQRPKIHILNVKFSPLGRKYSVLMFYLNVDFPDFKYDCAYNIILLGARFEKFIIPIYILKDASKTLPYDPLFLQFWSSLKMQVKHIFYLK